MRMLLFENTFIYPIPHHSSTGDMFWIRTMWRASRGLAQIAPRKTFIQTFVRVGGRGVKNALSFKGAVFLKQDGHQELPREKLFVQSTKDGHSRMLDTLRHNELWWTQSVWSFKEMLGVTMIHDWGVKIDPSTSDLFPVRLHSSLLLEVKRCT